MESALVCMAGVQDGRRMEVELVGYVRELGVPGHRSSRAWGTGAVGIQEYASARVLLIPLVPIGEEYCQLFHVEHFLDPAPFASFSPSAPSGRPESLQWQFLHVGGVPPKPEA